MRTYGFGNTIKSFYEVSSFEYTAKLTDLIKGEIAGKTKDYILGVDEEEFKQYLIARYTLEPLTIDFDSATVDEPTITKEWMEDRMWREKYEVEVYNFTVRFAFTGSSVLFKVQPSGGYVMTTAEIYVEENASTVSFSFKLHKKDPAEFNRIKAEFQKRAFTNLPSTNKVAVQWNSSLSGLVSNLFQQQKSKYLQENDFFAAINVKVDKGTSSVFSAPTVKKKIVPQPTVSNKKEFASEPMMSNEMYDDILKVIYDLGKSMERKPSTYVGKDEEGMRDQFLLILETRYDGTTASGETFNKGGKTDIILKYANDGSNLFVAECKFWHGASEFHKAISQLFDRYLTWRDSKVALIVFVKNNDFSNVIETIKAEAPKHPYYLRSVGNRGETSFSYKFHLPTDNEKPVQLEIIAFHYHEIE